MAALGRILGVLGPLLGALGPLLGVPGPPVGCSWRVAGALCALLKNVDFSPVFACFAGIGRSQGELLEPLGAPWAGSGASWKLLGWSWAPLGALLGCLGAILAALGALLDRSWELLGPLGAILVALGSEPLILRIWRQDGRECGGAVLRQRFWASGSGLQKGEQQPETSY